jgi:hypothetical protein
MARKIWRGVRQPGRRLKTSLVIHERLLWDLKLQAHMERTDVSRLLCRLGEAYLKRKGVRR